MRHDHKKIGKKPNVDKLVIEFVYGQLLELKQEVVIIRENLNRLIEEKSSKVGDNITIFENRFKLNQP